MSFIPRSHRLLVLAALAAIALWAWLGRAHLERWTRAELAARHQQQLTQLSDEGAATLIAHLAAADDEYLDLLVLALNDPRPAVANAAERALDDRVNCWSRWPQTEAGPRVAALAGLLAPAAESVPRERRAFIQKIAERLLAWPLDGRLIDSGRLIADCEIVLRLPLPAPVEDRIALQVQAEEPAIEPELPSAGAPQAALPLPLSGQSEPVPPTEPTPRVVFPEQPKSLPDANRESPTEPRQFIAPKAIRISDE
jgi:hypothetical protein